MRLRSDVEVRGDDVVFQYRLYSGPFGGTYKLQQGCSCLIHFAFFHVGFRLAQGYHNRYLIRSFAHCVSYSFSEQVICFRRYYRVEIGLQLAFSPLVHFAHAIHLLAVDRESLQTEEREHVRHKRIQDLVVVLRQLLALQPLIDRSPGTIHSKYVLYGIRYQDIIWNTTVTIASLFWILFSPPDQIPVVLTEIRITQGQHIQTKIQSFVTTLQRELSIEDGLFIPVQFEVVRHPHQVCRDVVTYVLDVGAVQPASEYFPGFFIAHVELVLKLIVHEAYVSSFSFAPCNLERTKTTVYMLIAFPFTVHR